MILNRMTLNCQALAHMNTGRMPQPRPIAGICNSAKALNCTGFPPSVPRYPREFQIKSPQAGFQISSFPNPFTGSTEIRYTLRNSSQVKISVYDMNGRLIRCLPMDMRLPVKSTFGGMLKMLRRDIIWVISRSLINRDEFLKTLKMQVKKQL